jgi:hypothetical protein
VERDFLTEAFVLADHSFVEQISRFGGLNDDIKPHGEFMKKFSIVMAALATIAVAAPTIASAQDKPMMHKGDMNMHHGMHHKMMMHHKMRMMHHKKMMMKKDGM